MIGVALLLVAGTTVADHEAALGAAEVLAAGLRAVTADEVVLIQEVTGVEAGLVRSAVEEALVARGLRPALTEGELGSLLGQYKARGIDPYEDPEVQALLRAVQRAKLSISVNTDCAPAEDGERACNMLLRARLPGKVLYSGHQPFELSAAEPSAANVPAAFWLLLVAYALVPAFLHRLDFSLRAADGRWRTRWALPVHVLGNRFSVFVMSMSFMVVGPRAFERWVMELAHDERSELMTFGLAYAALMVLNLLGSVLMAHWRERGGSAAHRATFGELFLWHPHFWTVDVEARRIGG